MAGEQTLKHLGQARSKGRVLLFLMSKQNLNPLVGASSVLKVVKNEIGMDKVTTPKIEGVKHSKKQTMKCYKGRFFEHPFNYLYVALLL